MSHKSQELAGLLGQVIFCQICGFGSAFLERRLNQSVSDKTSIDCLMCTAKQRVPEEKSQTLAAISAVMFFNVSFGFFFMGIRYDDRQTGSRFLGPVCVYQAGLGISRNALMLIHDLSRRIHKREIAETICITRRYLSRCWRKLSAVRVVSRLVLAKISIILGQKKCAQ